ncbi:MAG TPA: hypothetical protein VN088_16940, partial [Nocardioides sp.]|nr:hypothetical protein [Nocardioides sp.]
MRYPVSSPDRAIPSRHPDHPLPVPAAVGLLARTMRVEPADDAEFRRYGEALTEGDPLMDEVVAWMTATGRTEGKRLFERALTHGIATVPDAPDPLRALFEEVERTPAWVDRDLLDRGARVLR